MITREGQRLGNYRLHRLLGKGSFAEVYLGEHLYLRNYAAIKLLHTSLDEQDEQLFLSEAQTIARLTHPNIVRVREFAIERALPFLVMDYAPGGTLRHRYPTGTCLSLDQTVRYVKQIASALQYAHNHGIIHRDVKPENVLLGADQVMLSDFGISVHAPKPNTTTSQEWAGTLPYMAPEQFLGQAIFASDQYALAILTYEWLCGVRPFAGSSTALAYQHSNIAPPRLREKDPSLPEAVETVVLKALSKDPEDRYVSVINYARALERATQDSGYEIAPDAATAAADAFYTTHDRRVFLSHAALDDPARLHTDLTLREVSVQDDTEAEFQEEKARQTIRAAQAILLMLTPQTPSSAAVKEHLRLAALYRRSIIGIWASGDHLRDLLPAGAEHAEIIDARGPRYQQALDEIISALEREYRGAHRAEAPLPDLDFEPRNPYKGLRPFARADRADFFGRERVVQDLLAHVKKMVRPPQDQAPGPRFLAVVGPSGSGKSSVVMAGLLPRLQDGALPRSDDWLYLDPLVPGKQPLESLVRRLSERFPKISPQNIRATLMKEGGFGLHQLAFTLVNQPGTYLVLTIDQFEELFSPDVPEQERQHFLQLLVTAASEPSGSVIVLLTLRADFYDRPFAYPALGRLIQQQQCAIMPMSIEDLRDVIERPAFLPDVRLTFDEDLVGDLLFDIRGQVGALPLLEFALDQLFAHRREHRLTRHAYQEIGGVRGALARHAEATYTALPSDEHRQLVRTLFLRLVQPGADGQEPLRRRADSAEFVLERPTQTRLLREVIDAFLAARLIMVNQDASASTLEISHEALIREWPRLTNWLQEAREDMRLQQIMSNDMREWERRGKPKDRLYRGSQLKESLAWQGRNPASDSEAAFLRASTRRRTQGRISLALVALLLLAILIPAGVIIQQQFAPPTVTTLKDDAPGSLRQTISTARSGSTIIIDPGLKGTLVLNQDLIIDKNLTIRGSNVNQLTLRGTIQIQFHATVTLLQLKFSDPTLHAVPIITNNQSTLILDGCQITGNRLTSGEDGDGVGAIMSIGGSLTLQDSLISHNTMTVGNGFGSGFGSGIANYDGTLVVKNSQIVDNAVIASGVRYASGGGIYTASSQVTLLDSTIARNRITGASTRDAGGGISSFQDHMVLRNTTVSGNSVVGKQKGLAYGGGIMNTGSTITIESSHLLGNMITGGALSHGGAIYSENYTADNKLISSGSVTITNSTLSNNTVTSTDVAVGGAISIKSGNMTISRTTIAQNTVTSQQQIAGGGGIFNAGSLTITDSLISSNSVTAPTDQHVALGGGIDTIGVLNLSRSTIALNTISSNRGIAGGGGIFSDQPISANSRITLSNCTIFGNKALGANGIGGGFSTTNVPTSTRIDFCTIANNVASTRGGGIDGDGANTPNNAELILKNSLVAGNTAGTDPDLSAGVLTGGYNLIQHLGGATINDPAHLHTTDLSADRAANPGIDTQLRNNGGPTPTQALQATSPAIHAVPASACDLSTDQRGTKRPQGAACDIGAYEYQ